MSDRTIGIVGLAGSFIFISYLFLRLILIPNLPLKAEYRELLLPPTYLLITLGTCGALFVGSIMIYTTYTLSTIKTTNHRN